MDKTLLSGGVTPFSGVPSPGRLVADARAARAKMNLVLHGIAGRNEQGDLFANDRFADLFAGQHAQGALKVEDFFSSPPFNTTNRGGEPSRPHERGRLGVRPAMIQPNAANEANGASTALIANGKNPAPDNGFSGSESAALVEIPGWTPLGNKTLVAGVGRTRRLTRRPLAKDEQAAFVKGRDRAAAESGT